MEIIMGIQVQKYIVENDCSGLWDGIIDLCLKKNE
jgi:hypothetical protein